MFFIFEYLLKDNHLISLFGVFVFLVIAVIFSNNKRRIKPLRIVYGLIMQFLLAFFVLKTSVGHQLFQALANGFTKIYSFADDGIRFMFGNLIDSQGAWGWLYAVKVVPIIIFFGALMALLYHFRIIQICVKMVAFIIRPLLGTSGAETLCATANSMLGPTEAPLLIKKYLKNMTDSEMLVVMVSGMATMAAQMIAAYGSMGVPMIHMLTAAVMSIPGALVVSKILIPETKIPETAAADSIDLQRDTSNMIEAISNGTTDGLRLAANVAAMLISFISLMAMFNYILTSTTGSSLNQIFAVIFSRVAYFLGIPSQDLNAAGALLGQKLVINEFIAFVTFIQVQLTERSREILTYAIGGFANFSVIGILIGGIGALVPSKKPILVKLGLKALLGATLVNLMNASIASLFI